MKKFLSVALALVLAIGVFVFPANAAGQTYMIFACETDDGAGQHAIGWGTKWGPVAKNDEYGHPAPVQGEFSYAIATDTGNTVLYHNVSLNDGTPYPNTTGEFNMTGWEYIELDLYCNYDTSFNSASKVVILFDWQFAVTDDTSDAGGKDWMMRNAVLPIGEWVHVRMPISEFNANSVNTSKIHRIKMQFTNICDSEYWEPPLNVFFYIDNVQATKGGAGSANELKDWEWWEPIINGDDDDSSEIQPPPVPSDPESSEIQPPVSSDVTPTIKYGDIDGVEGIAAGDALTALQFAVGKIDLSAELQLAADVDGVEGVAAGDALCILQYAVGKIEKFPVENK